MPFSYQSIFFYVTQTGWWNRNPFYFQCWAFLQTSRPWSRQTTVQQSYENLLIPVLALLAPAYHYTGTFSIEQIWNPRLLQVFYWPTWCGSDWFMLKNCWLLDKYENTQSQGPINTHCGYTVLGSFSVEPTHLDDVDRKCIWPLHTKTSSYWHLHDKVDALLQWTPLVLPVLSKCKPQNPYHSSHWYFQS